MHESRMIALAFMALGSSEMGVPEFGPSNRHRNNRTPYVGRDAGRNEPCPCGSGKKYKRCCMRVEAEQFEQRREELNQ
jgi:hypothetical protein